MAKLINDDGTEVEINMEDYVSKEELSEKYVAKEDYDDLQAKYDKKKEQTKQAYANQDKVKQEALADAEEKMANRIREEIAFTSKYGFDTIPEEVKAAKAQHPTLNWEQAYQISWYKAADTTNPNPWRENIVDAKKTEFTFEEVSDLALTNPKMYNEVASKIESGEFKMI